MYQIYAQHSCFYIPLCINFLFCSSLSKTNRSHLIKEILTNCSFFRIRSHRSQFGFVRAVSVFNISLKLYFNNVFSIFVKFLPYLIEVLYYNVTSKIKINDLI